MSEYLNDKVVLITGGTGSFGKEFVRHVLNTSSPSRLIVFSRDELKQLEMRDEFPDKTGSPMRYFIGDVRDRERLRRATQDVDIIVHAAAMKQVLACEYNPIEAVATNVEGARNVIDAALDNEVEKVVALSTDKAVNPVNLYGATKLVAEKLFVQANAYAGRGPTRFSCVRYGNVVGSRGSVVPLFLQQKASKRVTVTDTRMTRFWITLNQGVRFVINCIGEAHGGEVMVPKIPSTSIMDIVKVLAEDCEVEVIGIRSGEKLHELLVSVDEARHTVDMGDRFVIQPAHPWWRVENWAGKDLPDGFAYASDTNEQRLSPQELSELIDQSGVVSN